MPKLLWRILPIMILVALPMLRLHACSQPPGYGYIVLSIHRDLTGPFPIDSAIPFQTLTGDFRYPSAGTLGSTLEWSGPTDGSGLRPELGVATPATWDITYNSGLCSPSDPLLDGPSKASYFFFPNSTPQKILCIEKIKTQGFSIDPGSFDTSSGTYQFPMTMTAQSGNWDPYPAMFVNFDAYGNIVQQGPVQEVDNANCSATFWANSTAGALQYIWLQDPSGNGIGYAQISVTNGSQN